jgi:DNA-binding XRE family transcriptional regulator
MAREPEAIAERRRALGARLAVFRRAAELTQGQLATVAFCDRTTIVHIEKGRARADERFWRSVDDACAAGGALLTTFLELEAAKAQHERQQSEQQLAGVRARAAELRGGQSPGTGTQPAELPRLEGRAGQFSVITPRANSTAGLIPRILRLKCGRLIGCTSRRTMTMPLGCCRS